VDCSQSAAEERVEGSITAPPEQDAPVLQRSRHLAELVKLRRVYRAVLGASYLLSLPSPVYEPAPEVENGDREGQSPPGKQDAPEDEALRRAVQAIVAMYLTEEEIKTSMRLLEPSFGDLLEGADPAEAQRAMEARVREVSAGLMERASKEATLLPDAGKAMLAAERSAWDPRQEAAAASSEAPVAGGEGAGPLQRVVQGEQQLEKYIMKKVAPFVKSRVEVSLQNPGSLLDGAKSVKDYGAGLWERLNGKGSGSRVVKPGELGLPSPSSSKQEVEKEIEGLSSEIDALEKRVQEASKSREARVRSSGLQTKARLAVDLMAMDREVINLSHTLGIRTLQLEMLYVYQTLEQEALEITEYSRGAGQIIPRASTMEDLALLVAEYSLLSSQLHKLEQQSGEDSYIEGADSGVNLEQLARDIPDLRTRLGIGDGLVFGGGGLSFRRIQMSVKEFASKIAEGVTFMITGLRILGEDLKYALQIFLRAARGGTLKPREVQALRRSVRDMLTFIPFTIILIIPLSPIGHVLVFGFIQRYFPGLYPSQFTVRRQEIMKRYEDLKRQLSDAQKTIEMEDEKQELERAAEAVARLMAPRSRLHGPDDSQDGEAPGGKATELRDLEARVAAAKDDHLGFATDEPRR